MITVLVANTKGGCGKTTVATHLAAAFATGGLRSALADADKQGSSLGWLRGRPASAAPIRALDWRDGPDKTPKQVDRLIIDAPAAMKMTKIADLLRLADIIVVPVLPSGFDTAATGDARTVDRGDGERDPLDGYGAFERDESTDVGDQGGLQAPIVAALGDPGGPRAGGAIDCGCVCGGPARPVRARSGDPRPAATGASGP